MVFSLLRVLILLLGAAALVFPKRRAGSPCCRRGERIERAWTTFSARKEKIGGLPCLKFISIQLPFLC